jgi:hypothetical protein
MRDWKEVIREHLEWAGVDASTGTMLLRKLRSIWMIFTRNSEPAAFPKLKLDSVSSWRLSTVPGCLLRLSSDGAFRLHLLAMLRTHCGL